MAKVKDAWSEAVERGWAVTEVSVSDIAREVQDLRVTVVPTRPGDPAVSRLRARPAEAASVPSLSSMFGLAPFPLHTDGAHLRHPPDAIFLEFDGATTSAPTMLYRVAPEQVDEVVAAALQHGVFEIGLGSSTYLGTVLDSERLRFDPIVMRARDPLALLAVDFLASCQEEADELALSGPGTTLVIDNRQTLHGRAAVETGQRRCGRRLMLRWTIP